MRVLHVIRGIDPESGGPPIVAASLAAGQIYIGHDASLLYWGSDPTHRGPMDEPLGKDIVGFDRIDHVRLPPAGLVEKLTGRAAAAAAEAYIERHRPDIIHLHNVWESLLASVAKVARRHRIPYLLTPHGMLDPWSMQQKALKKKVALALSTRRMLEGAAALHALNADEARGLKPLRLSTDVVRLPNGVWPQQLVPPPDAPRLAEKVPVLGEQPFVLFLSRLHHKKGLDHLAAAFEIVAADRSNVQLVVAGPDGGGRDELMQAISASKFGDRVHVVGPLYGAAKFAAIVDAAVYCLPSRQEGFPLAVLEALGCGTAVVISEQCNVPEVADVDAGRVVKLDATSVAAALGELLDDAALRERMGLAGKRLVAERFSWPRVAEQSIDVYQGLLGSA
ncbi:MAG: glycosyltransferase [Planctomycetota bacterium]